MTTTNEKVYIAAFTPTGKAATALESLKEKHPELNPYTMPAHITLYPPFVSPNYNERQIIDALTTCAAKVPASTITCNTLDSFADTNYVLYLKPDAPSTIFIKTLHNRIHEALQPATTFAYPDYTYIAHEFNPHLTLAEHIPADQVENIKKEFGTLSEPITFIARAIDLYSRSPETKIYSKVSHIPLHD